MLYFGLGNCSSTANVLGLPSLPTPSDALLYPSFLLINPHLPMGSPVNKLDYRANVINITKKIDGGVQMHTSGSE